MLLRIAIERLAQGDQLVDDDAERPNVSLETILFTSADLRCKIVRCTNLSLRHSIEVFEGSRDTEVTELKHALFDKDVLSFQVSM